MNWYKQSQVINTVTKQDAIDYVTNTKSSDILWFIDDKYKIHTISEQQLEENLQKDPNQDIPVITHDYWPEFQSNPHVAYGRYDGEKIMANMTPIRDIDRYSDRFPGKIQKILMKKFDTADIKMLW